MSRFTRFAIALITVPALTLGVAAGVAAAGPEVGAPQAGWGYCC